MSQQGLTFSNRVRIWHHDFLKAYMGTKEFALIFSKSGNSKDGCQHIPAGKRVSLYIIGNEVGKPAGKRVSLYIIGNEVGKPAGKRVSQYLIGNGVGKPAGKRVSQYLIGNEVGKILVE